MDKQFRMLNKIFISIISLASICWIGYVGYDILTDKSNYAESSLFGHADRNLLIVNRPNEVVYENLSGFSSPAIPIATTLNTTNIATIYLSEAQDHILIKGKQNWNSHLISALIDDSLYDVNISQKKFTYNGYEGSYFKKGLYLKRGTIAQSDQLLPRIKYDINASASIIEIDSTSSISSVSDIYFLPNGKTDYITRNDLIPNGKQINDETIFAQLITNKFTRYHFFERDYFASIDSVFNNSPMMSWMKNGFVEIEYKGKKALISDYVQGQDPLLILNDIMQTQDSISFTIPLTLNFPTEGNQFHIKYLEDCVVLSEDETICDKIIADHKLGNTIALNEDVRRSVYGQLPGPVSERLISTSETYSKAFYKGKILQTKIGSDAISVQEIKKETITMNCGFDIADFEVYPGYGNAVAISPKGEIINFKQEKQHWKKSTNSPFIGKIQLIDLYDNGEKYVLINSRNKIHLINQDGEYSSGFPISTKEEITNEVKFYRWKGESYFMYANANNQVVHLDGKGRELSIYNSSIPITRKIDVWVSQSKLFAGFANDTHFEMFNIDKRRKHRDFALPSICVSAKIPNELLQFGIKNNQLFKMNQGGNRFDYISYPKAKILSVNPNNRNPIIILQVSNEIHLLNTEGIPFSQIRLPFNEVDDVYVETNSNGATLIAIVDGLENNVYLYNLNGEKIQKRPIEGQKKVITKKLSTGILVSTIMDQFITQYFE